MRRRDQLGMIAYFQEKQETCFMCYYAYLPEREFTHGLINRPFEKIRLDADTIF